MKKAVLKDSFLSNTTTTICIVLRNLRFSLKKCLLGVKIRRKYRKNLLKVCILLFSKNKESFGNHLRQSNRKISIVS